MRLRMTRSERSGGINRYRQELIEFVKDEVGIERFLITAVKII